MRCLVLSSKCRHRSIGAKKYHRIPQTFFALNWTEFWKSESYIVTEWSFLFASLKRVFTKASRLASEPQVIGTGPNTWNEITVPWSLETILNLYITAENLLWVIQPSVEPFLGCQYHKEWSLLYSAGARKDPHMASKSLWRYSYEYEETLNTKPR